MPRSSGTSPGGGRTETAGRRDHERPKIEIPGLEGLFKLSTNCRSPAHELQQFAKRVGTKVTTELKGGYAAIQKIKRGADGNKPMTASSSLVAAVIAKPDHRADKYKINGEFMGEVFGVDAAEYKHSLDTNAVQLASAARADKHSVENGYKLVALLLSGLDDDLALDVREDSRFRDYDATGDASGVFDLIEEKLCGIGDSVHPIYSFMVQLRRLLVTWQSHDEQLATYREEKDATVSLLHRLNGGEAFMAPRALVVQELKNTGLDDDAIDALTYNSGEVKDAERTVEEKILTFIYMYGANRGEYGPAVVDLEIDYMKARTPEKKAAVWYCDRRSAMNYLTNRRRIQCKRPQRRTGCDAEPTELSQQSTKGRQCHQQFHMRDASTKVDEVNQTGCVHCANPDGDDHSV